MNDFACWLFALSACFICTGILLSQIIWNLAIPIPDAQNSAWKHFLLGFQHKIFRQNCWILLKSTGWFLWISFHFVFFRQTARQRGKLLKEWFTNSGAAFIKFAQIITSREHCQDGFFEAEFLEELADLRENVRPHLSLEQVWAVVKTYDPEKSYIKYLSPEPIGVGSSGQVHLGLFCFKPDQKKKEYLQELVAIKFRNPNLTEEIAFSFALIRLVCRVCACVSWLYPHQLFRVLAHPSTYATLQRFEFILHEQDDMLREVQKQNKALNGCLNRPGQPARVMTPITAVPELNNKEMFLMELLPLDSIQPLQKRIEQLKADTTLQITGEDLAKGFVDICLSNIIEDKLLHSDLHAGNIKITADSKNECKFQFIFLDWPICPELKEQELKNIQHYISSCVLKDPYQLAHSTFSGSLYARPRDPSNQISQKKVFEACQKFCRNEYTNWKEYQQDITKSMMNCCFFESHLRDLVVFMQNFESNVATCLQDPAKDSMVFAMDYAQSSHSKNMSLMKESFISKQEFENLYGFC